MRRIRSHLTYANVMSTIAVFGVLAGGGAYAASKIGTSDIENGAVTAKKLHKRAVTKKKLKNRAVTKAKLGDRAVRARNLGPIKVVSETLTVPNADNGQVAAFCPEGTRRVGGGAASQVFGLPISGSRPTGTTGWDAFLRNDTGMPRDLTAYVLCLKG
jgi:hypothetical protein